MGCLTLLVVAGLLAPLIFGVCGACGVCDIDDMTNLPALLLTTTTTVVARRVCPFFDVEDTTLSVVVQRLQNGTALDVLRT